MLACGNTRLYELIAAGEIESYRDGRSRKIPVASIQAYVRQRIEAERAASGRGAPRRRGRPRKIAPETQPTPQPA
jgi:excisionase family DNA binding protein